MKRRGWALVVLVVLAAGCGRNDVEPKQPSATTATTAASEGRRGFGEADADTVLDYKLVDYAFEGPRSAQGPKVYFKAENAGTQDHELEVLDPDGEPVGEIESFPPGGTADPLAVELPAGVYTLQCILKTKDGKVHRDLGMVAELRVESP